MKKELVEILEKANCFDKIEKLEIINYLLDENEADIETISRA